MSTKYRYLLAILYKVGLVTMVYGIYNYSYWAL